MIMNTNSVGKPQVHLSPREAGKLRGMLEEQVFEAYEERHLLSYIPADTDRVRGEALLGLLVAHDAWDNFREDEITLYGTDAEEVAKIAFSSLNTLIQEFNGKTNEDVYSLESTC